MNRKQKTEDRRQKSEDGGQHGERLQKILSQAGVASRRLAEELIVQGRVQVNGVTVTALGTKADPNTDEIKVDDRRIQAQKHKRYILLHKPRGYMTTRSDPEGRPTVLDLLRGVREYIYPVGRLDYDSEGLLLLTNDGELAARLTHPRHEIDKVYEARVRGVPDEHVIARLEKGVTIDGHRTAPAKVRVLDPPKKFQSDSDQTRVELAIHEGRQRQVRQMFDAVGHPVVRLKRVRIGPISDPDMPPGHWRELTPQEVARLQRATGLAAAGPTGGRPTGRRPTDHSPAQRSRRTQRSRTRK
jgi:23S rRNA pseudouridine2605 synthase